MSPKDRIPRRARLVSAALVSVGACGGEVEGEDGGKPMACLDVAVDACLAMRLDAGPDTMDTGPQPCLTPLPSDAGEGG